MRLAVHSLIVFSLFIFSTIYFAESSFAATTPFRSAATITTDGATPYINLSNCSATDGATCDHPTAARFANLYFSNFGDFGIPNGSATTAVKIRMTGKSTFGLYIGVSGGTVYSFNCQFPSDLWATFGGSIITTQNFTTSISNGQLKSCLSLSAIQSNNFIWRLNFSSIASWSANIDNFEIAFDYQPQITPSPTPTLTPSPTLTPTPSPTPTPTPTPAPAPFLDLPWDYEGKGLSFNEAALSINSYFDHEYPLLGSGLTEPAQTSDSIINYQISSRQSKQYSSHDGYDYGKVAGANIGNHVLAAAGGIATYVNSCAPCGNMIVIDHENGYQTRYLHLQYDGLVTTVPGTKVRVTQGQAIGKVGASGNVSPLGDAGAHIHFGLFQDKNKDGNFDDNVPDGVTDPFGWQSKDSDPWENYSFFYNGLQRTGNKSYYLWKKKLDNLDATLSANGAVFTSGKASVNFPQGATNQNLSLTLQSSPIVKLTNNLNSVGSSIIISTYDSLKNIVTSFQKLFTLTIDYNSIDLSRYKTDTLAIYSSPDGKNWQKETTSIDSAAKTASAQLNHLTHFALMAERIDTTPPTTTAILNGQQGQPNWFRSDVELTLSATDNQGGLGVDYTLYRLEGKDWEIYKTPLSFTNEGHYKVEFYSADKDENIEDKKSVEFDIDKTAPEATISATPVTLWPPNGKLIDILISGNAQDTHLYTKTISVEDEYHSIEPKISDFGQTIQLQAKREGGDLDGRVYIIKVRAEDLAGNTTEKQTQVVVPHDQSGKTNEKAK